MSPRARHVTLDTIREAARDVYGVAMRTPIVRLEIPDDWRERYPRAPRDLLVKLETLQPVGSFKIRGAFTAIARLSAAERAGGVWTVSAGNAAQGVALAARELGAPCTVLVIDTAPRTKLDAVRRLGATLVPVTHEEAWRTVESRESPHARGVFVHPFDDDAFISGNGTIGLELVEDVPDLDTVFVPVGGGGLAAGVARAVLALRPDASVVGVEPVTAAPFAASRAAGRPVRFDGWQASFVDGAGGRSVLPGMWPLLESVTGAHVVELDDVRQAMRLVAERLHVIAEGAAASAVAAALTATERSGRMVAVLSGGNIDLPRFAALVGAVPGAI